MEPMATRRHCPDYAGRRSPGDTWERVSDLGALPDQARALSSPESEGDQGDQR